MYNNKSIHRTSRDKDKDDREKENSSKLSNYMQPLTEKNRKSHRHHLVSCEQIMTLAKKKLASSMHDLNSHHQTNIIKDMSSLKNKKKKKKEKRGKSKTPLNHKTPTLKYDRFERQYPLSTSNSFIQFS